MDSEVEQLMQNNLGSRMKLVDHDDDESTAKIFKAFEPVDRATTRSMPTQIQFITRYSLPKTPWWGEFSILSVGKADDLSLKDLTDNSRIPQNGTPGYTLLGAGIGAAFGEGISLNFAAENLSNEDYRVHGSGLNGSGRNFIISFTYNH